MADEGSIYLVDTDVLALIHTRKDSSNIYDGIIGLIQAGTVKTVRQVMGELKRFRPQYAIISPHSKNLVIGAALQ